MLDKRTMKMLMVLNSWLMRIVWDLDFMLWASSIISCNYIGWYNYPVILYSTNCKNENKLPRDRSEMGTKLPRYVWQFRRDLSVGEIFRQIAMRTRLGDFPVGFPLQLSDGKISERHFSWYFVGNFRLTSLPGDLTHLHDGFIISGISIEAPSERHVSFKSDRNSSFPW